MVDNTAESVDQSLSQSKTAPETLLCEYEAFKTVQVFLPFQYFCCKMYEP